MLRSSYSWQAASGDIAGILSSQAGICSMAKKGLPSKYPGPIVGQEAEAQQRRSDGRVTDSCHALNDTSCNLALAVLGS